MNQVRCLQHRKYLGLEAPNLNCVVCCDIFIDKIIKENEEKKLSPSRECQKNINKKRAEKFIQGSKHWLSVK